MFYSTSIDTIVGKLYLVTDDNYVYVVAFDDNWPRLQKKFSPMTQDSCALMDQLKRQLNEYFEGRRQAFDLPIKYEGTDFQLMAWQELKKIPYGQTISYQAQAENMKNPKAIRAVGGANGRNPLCILIPCHRVIAKSGKLQGFAGDIHIKKTLIELEATQSR